MFGIIAFYETTHRELALYDRSPGSKAARRAAIQLLAEIHGQYTGRASSAYFYYTAEQKWWLDGLKIKVEQP